MEAPASPASDPPPAAGSLSSIETSELLGLQRLVDGCKILPDTVGWRRWLELLAKRDGLPAPVPEPSSPPAAPSGASAGPQGAPPRDFKSWAAFYFPDAAEPARVKAIDRLRRAGRNVGLLPPLDHPAAMPAWFETMRSRHGLFPRGCPENFRLAATRASGMPENADAALPGHAVPLPPVHAPDTAPVAREETDPSAVLQRLMDDEVRLSREYDAARARSDPQHLLSEARRRRNEATTAVIAQRQHMEKHGHLIPARDATDAYIRIMRPLPQILENQFVKHPPQPGEPWPAAVRRIIRSVWALIPGDIRPQLTAS